MIKQLTQGLPRPWQVTIEWLVTIVELNPLTYAVDALRGAFIHFYQFDPKLGPIVLVVMAAVFFLIALRDFQKA